MITKISTQFFKRFGSQDFSLTPLTLLAGPNNSGKSTLLQAAMVWNLAMQKWWEKKGPGSRSKAKDRQGAPITRQEFTALPLPSMDQLWTDTHTSLRKDEGKQGAPRPMVISLHGVDDEKNEWQFGFEFRYSGPEQIHVKPVADDLPHLETARKRITVVYVPPFSGIGVNETRHDRPYQDMLIGQGKGGDILRNLLLEVAEADEGNAWLKLEKIIEEVFHYRLLKPSYDGTPYITCQYLKGIPAGRGFGGLPPLDVSTTGSGFHQVLLILAFMLARPSSLILLDEPDAHLHVLLQKQLYDILRSLCHQSKGQLVIATHSEVLIDSTSPSQIVSFYRKPHALASDSDRDQVREALKRVSSLELLLAENAKGILYLEGTTDFDLLKAWSEVLDHPVKRWFADLPFWQNNHGRNPKEARAHFFALKAVRPSIEGILLLDGDNRNLQDRELSGEGLTLLRWERYEAESYLLHPSSLERFLSAEKGPLFAQPAMDYLREQMPPAFFSKPLENSNFLRSEPASKTLLPEIFQRAEIHLPKANFFLLAQQMKKEEIPQEVTDKLTAIQEIVFTLPESNAP
ncbi:MAG: ATP-binding protein [Opitutales bacterium]|nr:ATP-binding protein [Opitutales bacterium]MCH8539802.1 ATP-binding protein [Opitutales bacterium]